MRLLTVFPRLRSAVMPFCWSLKGCIPVYTLVPQDDLLTIFSYLPKTNWDGTLRGLFGLFQQRFNMNELDMIYHSTEFSEFIKGHEKDPELRWNMDYIRKRLRYFSDESGKYPLQKPGHYMYIAYGHDGEEEERVLYIDATSTLGAVLENPPAGAERFWCLHTDVNVNHFFRWWVW